MRNIYTVWTLLFMGTSLIWSGCKPVGTGPTPGIWQDAPRTVSFTMEDSLRYDKILGALLGSAIGDAMGAPTEMWSREEIQTQYGFVSDLDDMIRAPSAEGTWAHNLPAGGTTDDTRWKVLMGDFLANKPQINQQQFAQHIVDAYQVAISDMQGRDGKEIEPLEADMRRIQWLREWALVSQPFLAGDQIQYQQALNRFYGGEMVCAGMLFSPVLGMISPGDPARAYALTQAINLFDIGYAQDISGLTAALVAAAMPPEASPDSIWRVFREVDPQGYFDSRLVGRSAQKWFETARRIDFAARQADIQATVQQLPVRLALPLVTPADSLRYARWSVAYAELDKHNMVFPFHPGEIHLINLTALLICDFDFVETLRFVVNYGRDNDTVAAVTGAIVGAYHGTSAIPPQWRQQIIETQLAMGIDLEALALTLFQQAGKTRI